MSSRPLAASAWQPVLLDLVDLDEHGALDGIRAAAQARLALARGQVPLPDGDLVTAAMMLQAAEGVGSRLERLALAAALLAAEMDATITRAQHDAAANSSPAGPPETIADLRGSMADGYEPEDVNRILGRISTVSGLRLVCVWATCDSGGPDGNSQFYVEENDGRLRELAGDLWRWLNQDPDDPDTPAGPGSPDSWLGEPAGFSTTDLGYHDGFGNYAWRDTS